MKSILQSLALPAILYAFFGARAVTGQPSGGPYGPVRQTYQLPKVTGTICYVAVDGDSSQSGRLLSKPTTIEAAVARVKTGDAIVMRGGTYRTGNLLLNQGITIQPYGDERPLLVGTYLASDWKDLGNGLWITKWTRLFPQRPADWWQRTLFGKQTPLCRFNNGFFFEISKGVVVAGNIFVNCDHGMMILNSSNVRIYNNTFVNSIACVGRNGRVAAGDRFGWHATTGPDVDERDGHVFVNNLLVGCTEFTRPLLFVWQPASL